MGERECVCVNGRSEREEFLLGKNFFFSCVSLKVETPSEEKDFSFRFDQIGKLLRCDPTLTYGIGLSYVLFLSEG